MKIELTVKKEFEVKYLKVRAGVRYFEDATVNDVEDTEGVLIPFKDENDNWCPLIDIDKGVIVDWPKDTTAEIHYKVCDDGTYTLLDETGLIEVFSKDGYVPSCLAPDGEGYGDYIILSIDGEGKIADWEKRAILEIIGQEDE